MTAEVCMSSSVKVWTSERLSLSEEGKASGLDSVVMVLAEVSAYKWSTSWCYFLCYFL